MRKRGKTTEIVMEKQKVVTEGVSSDLVSNEIGSVQERSIAKEALWVKTC